MTGFNLFLHTLFSNLLAIFVYKVLTEYFDI